jgi:hypothetical protein
MAYIDGRPAVIEENDGGFYGFVEDGEYVENYYQQQWWYVENGRWHSRFADHTTPIDLMEGYTVREINDGSQEVYDGDLEVAFAD